MGLQRKTGAGIETQVRQPYKREDHTALAEEGERTTRLWQKGDSVVATQLMAPEA